ncbi:MAG: pilin [Candidatus Saccharimonas sp.]
MTIKQYLVTGLIGLLASVGIGVAIMGQPAFAACDTPANCVKESVDSTSGGGQQKSAGDFIKIIVNILMFILGAIAVIMIIIGGIRYTTSNGDTNAITSAKNTIMYAVIGLVVAIMAYAIVSFVITQFTK